MFHRVRVDVGLSREYLSMESQSCGSYANRQGTNSVLNKYHIAKCVTIVCACFFLCGSRNLSGGMWDKLDILQFVICTFIGMCVQLKLCNICHIVFTVQSFVLRGLLISEGGLIVSGN